MAPEFPQISDVPPNVDATDSREAIVWRCRLTRKSDISLLDTTAAKKRREQIINPRKWEIRFSQHFIELLVNILLADRHMLKVLVEGVMHQ